MFNKTRWLYNAAMAGVMTALLTASGCGTTPPSRFYLLETAAPDSGAEASAGELHVGIRQVRIPEYLQRNEIVTRKNGAELEPAALHRWAEPLRDGVPRVLIGNISSLLNTEKVSVYPWPGGRPPDYEIDIRIVRFDADDNGVITLNAHWRIAGESVGEHPILRKSTIEERFSAGIGGSGFYGRIAAAHSRALTELSAAIVKTIQALDG